MFRGLKNVSKESCLDEQCLFRNGLPDPSFDEFLADVAALDHLCWPSAQMNNERKKQIRNTCQTNTPFLLTVQRPHQPAQFLT